MGLVQDLRFALRWLRRRPGFAATAVLTLALGVGVNAATFTVLDGVLIQGLPFPEPGRIVRVGETAARNPSLQPFNAANWLDVQRDTRDEFQALAAYRLTPAMTVTGLGEAVKAGSLTVGPEFFDVIGIPPIMGRTLNADDVSADARAIVVSAAFWRAKLSADPQVIGHVIDLDGQPWIIVGVVPDSVAFSEDVELWRPLVFSSSETSNRNSWSLRVIGRLRSGVSIAQANASLQHAMALVSASHPGPEPRSAAAVDLREDLVSFVRRDLLFAQGIGALILLIGCCNVTNLWLAAASSRRFEFQIRGCLGAGRLQLARQILAESLVIGVLGGALGAVLAAWIVPVMLNAYPGTLPGRTRVEFGALELSASILAAIVASALAGAIPAALAGRATRSVTLRADSRTTASPLTRWLRSGLVTAEVVMTLSLLAGAGVLIRSFARLTQQDVGFDERNVLTAYFQVPAARFPTDVERQAVFQRVIDRLANEPGVESAASALPLPFDGSGMGLGLRWDPALGLSGAAVGSARFVSPRYLDVLSVPLVRGRFFTDADRLGSPLVAVVNEAFARQHGRTRDVIGMRMRRSDDGPWITIVGVTTDVRANFYQLPRGEILFPLAQSSTVAGNFIVKTRGNPAAFAARLRELIRDVHPNAPIGRIEPLSTIVGHSVSDRRFNLTLLASLAALAVTLSLVGIYGVMSYLVGQRRREMGIRVALGAAPGQVRRLIVGQGVRPIALGIAGGLVGAWFLTSLLRTQLYEVKPHDPWSLVAVSFAFLMVGLAACWIPARQGSRVDPVEVLRQE